MSPRQLARSLRDRLRGASGQGLAEYALVLALVAIVAIVALTFMGQAILRVLFMCPPTAAALIEYVCARP